MKLVIGTLEKAQWQYAPGISRESQNVPFLPDTPPVQPFVSRNALTPKLGSRVVK